MYHQQDNLYFGRRANGSVRILKFSSSPDEFPLADEDPIHDVVLDATVEPSQWASIVAAVSAGGEDGERYRAALAFHAAGGRETHLKAWNDLSDEEKAAIKADPEGSI